MANKKHDEETTKKQLEEDLLTDATLENSACEKGEPTRETALLQKQLAEKEKELQKQKEDLAAKDDRYLRLAAEYDNFRRRVLKEKECIYSDAVGDTMTQILPILDNLERAVEFELAKETADKAVLEGIGKILTQFTDTLQKMGVAEIEAKNAPFDPELHNAVMHEENEEMGENLVAEVFVKGYKLGEKVLRHSVVKVVN